VVARATDNVGNEADSPPVTVTVGNPDTTPPAAPTLTLYEYTRHGRVVGTTLYYNPKRPTYGGFQVQVATDDPNSGIAHVVFPPVFSRRDRATDTQAAFERSYYWRPGETASRARTIEVTNGAGVTASAEFTVVPDTRKPRVAVARVGPDARIVVDASDAGAGVRSVEVRYCAGVTCRWRDGRRIGIVTEAPYEIVVTSPPSEGMVTILAAATDHVDNFRVSAPYVIWVGSGAIVAADEDDPQPTEGLPSLSRRPRPPSRRRPRGSRSRWPRSESRPAPGQVAATAAAGDRLRVRRSGAGATQGP
jgi:hypothetical protein